MQWTDLQASQAVFCFRGGGRVLASSWIWFCIVGEEKLKAGAEEDQRRARRDVSRDGVRGQGGHAHCEAEGDASGWSGRSMYGADGEEEGRRRQRRQGVCLLE